MIRVVPRAARLAAFSERASDTCVTFAGLGCFVMLSHARLWMAMDIPRAWLLEINILQSRKTQIRAHVELRTG